MRKHSRDRRPNRELQDLEAPSGRLLTYPLRLVLIATVSFMLVWLVLTKSLPFALAPSSPDLALALNPSNPLALVAKARQLREQLLAQGSPVPEPGKEEG